jgi:hypothetical protein
MGRWGQGAVNSRGKRQTNVYESAEKRKARVQRRGRHEFEQAGVWGSCVSGYSQQLLAKMSYYSAIKRQLCASSKSGKDKEERRH